MGKRAVIDRSAAAEYAANACSSAKRVAEVGQHFNEAVMSALPSTGQAIESELMPKAATAFCGRTT